MAKHFNYLDTPGSEFAKVYSALPAKSKRRIPIPEEIVHLLDMLIGVAKAFATSSSFGEIESKLKCLPNPCSGDEIHQALDDLLHMSESGTLQTIVKRFRNNKDISRFLQRILGSGSGIAVYQAVQQDLTFITVTLHEAMKSIMPVVSAWEDTLAVLNDEDLSSIAAALPTTIGILQALIKAEESLSGTALAHLPKELVEAAKQEINLPDTEKFEPTIDSVRLFLEADVENRVTAINQGLTRKLKGAVVALEYSPDGTSQAAGSLIELVDRMMREFADEHEVLRWLHDNGLEDDRYIQTLEKSSREKPTKFGQSLHFVYGGGCLPSKTTNDPGSIQLELINSYLAKSLTKARNNLQKIKHADCGTEGERLELQKNAAAILGVIELSHRFSWLYGGELPGGFQEKLPKAKQPELTKPASNS